MTRDWRAWLPEAALGATVVLLGWLEALVSSDPGDLLPLLLALVVGVGVGVAVGLSRRAPGAALVVVWVTGALQVVAGVDVMAVELSVVAVTFGTARWGSTATLLCSAASIPLGTVIAVFFIGADGIGGLMGVADLRSVVVGTNGLQDSWWVAAGLVGTAVLSAPWLAGLAFRFGDRARSSRTSQLAAEQAAVRAASESEQAREIARLRERQTQMTRDVHDAVGHSLAVILAQAESAQFLKDNDSEALQHTMRNIATSARSSLQDVRGVLASTNELRSTERAGRLEELVEGVRSSREVTSTVVGSARSLPPEIDTVAFRVLQEMLTNAIKHGRRDTVVAVEQRWDDELRIEVRNIEAGHDQAGDTRGVADAVPGLGLTGMRRRVEAVGGRLDTHRHVEAAGCTFIATAWLPLSAGGR